MKGGSVAELFTALKFWVGKYLISLNNPFASKAEYFDKIEMKNFLQLELWIEDIGYNHSAYNIRLMLAE